MHGGSEQVRLQTGSLRPKQGLGSQFCQNWVWMYCESRFQQNSPTLIQIEARSDPGHGFSVNPAGIRSGGAADSTADWMFVGTGVQKNGRKPAHTFRHTTAQTRGCATAIREALPAHTLWRSSHLVRTNDHHGRSQQTQLLTSHFLRWPRC